MTKCAQLLDENADFDFMDINMGCPIDLIYKQVIITIITIINLYFFFLYYFFVYEKCLDEGGW